MIEDNELIGVGLYSVPEASRLVSVHPNRIRRWIQGYSRQDETGELRNTPAIWRADAPKAGATQGLSFLDMMEVRMVDAFLTHGVTWPIIKEAADYARDLFEDRHPFTLKRFLTDGNRIFAEAVEGLGDRVLDLNRRQYVSKPIVEKSLFEGIDFEEGQAARWYPMHDRRHVVLDPSRAFGQPMLHRFGVPTETLFASYKAENGSIEAVANWYEIPKNAVRAAIDFENKIAA